MKTISEVCKQIGVTRRALQVYNDKGLLHPTSKTTGGYWLYDEESVQKLKLILILKEAGYSNKSIKEVLDKPDERLFEALKEACDSLEKKRQELEKQIVMIRFLVAFENISDHSRMAFVEFDTDEADTRLFKEHSFIETWHRAIQNEEPLTADVKEAVGSYYPVLLAWYAIGVLVGRGHSRWREVPRLQRPGTSFLEKIIEHYASIQQAYELPPDAEPFTP